MTLMQVKGLTSDDFAINHPAGQLGKRLTLTVGDLMHGGDANPTIDTDAVWMDIVKGITDGGLGAVNVIDEAGHLKGIITDGDLRRAIQQSNPSSLADLKCEEIMTRDPVVADPCLLAYDALRLMEDRPVADISVAGRKQRSRLRGPDSIARHCAQRAVRQARVQVLNAHSKCQSEFKRLCPKLSGLDPHYANFDSKKLRS